MQTFIISTSFARHLTEGLRRKVRSIKIIFPEENRGKKRYFPDGEIYLRMPSKSLSQCRGSKKRIIVLHSGAPQPNEGLVELELILQILKDCQIKPVVFFAYFPYGMQDKIFEKGETNVAENLIDKLVNFYKVKKICIIDPHFGGRKWIKKYPITAISATPLLIQKAKAEFSKDVLFLSPDIGGKRRTGISGIRKKRLNSFKVAMFAPKLELKGKTIGVVDDVIKTGGTLLKFAQIAKKAGAKKVLALITHGAIPAKVASIKRIYQKVYLTNTIAQNKFNVDVTDLIIKTIKEND